MTGLRKQIGYIAVLLASTVLFAHALVPHHHHENGMKVCLEAVSECTHHHAEPGALPEATVESECRHCHAESCTPTALFTFNHSADFGANLLPFTAWMVVWYTPLQVETNPKNTGAFYPDEPVPNTEYILSDLPRRAPPVLV